MKLDKMQTRNLVRNISDVYEGSNNDPHDDATLAQKQLDNFQETSDRKLDELRKQMLENALAYHTAMSQLLTYCQRQTAEMNQANRMPYVC